MNLPLVTFSLAAGVMNSSPSELTVPSVTKPVPLETPPDIPTPTQDTSSSEEVCAATSGDQSNGVALSQDMTKQTEETAPVASPVTEQGVTANPAGPSASVQSPVESVSAAEIPGSSSVQICEEATPSEEAKNQESVVAAVEFSNQEAKSDENVASGEPGAVAGRSPDNPKQSATEDIGATNECAKASDAAAAVEGPTDPCLDAAPPIVNDPATQNENLDQKEPVILLSKAIQSKGTSKCDGPPLSTRHLSGWLLV